MGSLSKLFKGFGDELRNQVCWFRYKFGMSLTFTQLKEVGARLAYKGSSDEYERLIEYYDAEINFTDNPQCKGFVGSDGFGQGTLNSFRVISSPLLPPPEGVAFEKIYNMHSIDWLKSSFFIKHHHEQFCDESVFAPFLINVRAGVSLVVANFTHVKVRRGALEEHRYLWRNCMSRLSNLTLVPGAPDEISDFMLHIRFARCLQKTKEFSESFHVPMSIFDLAIRRLEKAPRFVAHGDLSLKNTSLPNVVFDWDSFGYFPPGFDLAICMVESNLKLSKDAIDELARDHYPLYESRCDWDNFRFCLLFLYFVFSKTRGFYFKMSLLEVFLADYEEVKSG